MGIINFSKDKCRNCYKCIRNCPIKAIKLKNKHAQIVPSMCIGCGNCIKICPHNAKEIQNDVDQIKEWLKDEEVVLSLSGVFPTAFNLDHPRQYLGALRKLGFTVIEETSIGAEAVAKAYAKEYYSDKKFIIASSCPSIKNLIEIYYPEYIDCLSNEVSPMIAHGKILRKKYPKAKIIYAGSCLAKKMEVLEKEVRGIIDGVLTFDEIDTWLFSEKIFPHQMPIEEFDGMGSSIGRLYPLVGGIAKSSVEDLEGDRKILRLDGVEDCMGFLEEINHLKKNYWIEMNACEEGCINGPGNTHSLLSKYEKVEMVQAYIDHNLEKTNTDEIPEIETYRKFKARPMHHLEEVPEGKLEEILTQMGKFSEQDELNCGTCGYDTCRDKARAVYWNMAEVDMCLPLMCNKSEAISNLIITTTPNAIAVLDKKYRIIEFNEAAEHLFNVKREEVFHYNFMDILEYNPFRKLAFSQEDIYTGKGIYERENRVFMEILTYIPEQELYMGIFIDITQQERREESYKKMQEETLEMAQRVIDKQMRVAHEIAGLLGETTAETKVTLTKLQKVIGNREVEI
ncbi:MAG: [Fe-Fe] hydrogenase large subunit C-terminal domain-containing protein [Eubacteriaceae bacterium]